MGRCHDAGGQATTREDRFHMRFFTDWDGETICILQRDEYVPWGFAAYAVTETEVMARAWWYPGWVPNDDDPLHDEQNTTHDTQDVTQYGNETMGS